MAYRNRPSLTLPVLPSRFYPPGSTLPVLPSRFDYAQCREPKFKIQNSSATFRRRQVQR